MKTLTRKLGKSGIEVSAIGLGCWAIGGPLWYLSDGERLPLSWGKVDDKESIRTIHRALDLGITFFDTADSYGCGHSERILGQALEGRREDVIIATKFGDLFDEKTKTWLGHNHPNGIITQEFVRKACEASLKRLNTDYIDLYQLHWKEYAADLATDLLSILDDLVDEGKIRSYGWSTPNSKLVHGFAEGSHCASIQYNYNILERNPDMLALCENAIHEKGAVPPETTGTYWRLRHRHGMSDTVIKRYGTEVYEYWLTNKAYGMYPEWILQKLDRKWMVEIPSPMESSVYVANVRYNYFYL